MEEKGWQQPEERRAEREQARRERARWTDDCRFDTSSTVRGEGFASGINEGSHEYARDRYPSEGDNDEDRRSVKRYALEQKGNGSRYRSNESRVSREQELPKERRRVSSSRSASPDLDVAHFLAEQQAARPVSPKSEAARRERLAAGGSMRTKSKLQREKEEQERKRKEADEEAERAYQDFVADMEGKHGAGAGRPRASFVTAGGAYSYKPATQEPHALSKSQKAAEESSTLGSGHEKVQRGSSTAALSTKERRDPLGKKRGALNDFLEQLQRDQARREELQHHRPQQKALQSSMRHQEISSEVGSRHGRKNPEDVQSTNICVINLPSNINELGLGHFFAQWGDVATVKIMWPRGEEFLPGTSAGLRSTSSAGLTGFVSFMRRSAATKAMRGADGLSWSGTRLRTSWGKSMPLPLRPAFVSVNPEKDFDERSKRSRQRSESPKPRRHRRRVHCTTFTPIRRLREALLTSSDEGPETERRVRQLAQRIRESGPAVEDQTARLEAQNPHYAFLFDLQSLAYRYMRALVDVHHLHGDEDGGEEVAFEDDGTASLYSTDSEENSERESLQQREKSDTLGKAARRRFEAMLRSVTLRRERIARAMAFAIEHASAASAISDILVDSLIQAKTPLARKQARLYIISDILHNSATSASHAWRYRSLFETRMSRVFAHLGDVAKSFSGRIKREASKDWIRSLLSVWESWLVFPQQTIIEWSSLLENGSLREGAKDKSDRPQGLGLVSRGQAQQSELETTLNGYQARRATSDRLKDQGHESALARLERKGGDGAFDDIDGERMRTSDEE